MPPGSSTTSSCSGNCLRVRLQVTGHEVIIGNDLRADIITEDELGRMYVIEAGWATRTTHLGQLVTYAAMTGADVLIWVIAAGWADGAPLQLDHVAVLDMLNAGLASPGGPSDGSAPRAPRGRHRPACPGSGRESSMTDDRSSSKACFRRSSDSAAPPNLPSHRHVQRRRLRDAETGTSGQHGLMVPEHGDPKQADHKIRV